MGFLARLFPGADAGAKLIDLAARGVNQLVWTKQEQAEASAEEREKVRAYKLDMWKATSDYMRATAPHNLTRRVLALSTACCFFGSSIVVVCLQVAAVWIGDPETVQRVRDSAAAIQSFLGDFTALMGMVFAFYLGSPVTEKLIGAIGGAKK